MSQAADGDDVTTPRPNPHSRWRCGLEPMGLACSAGPSDQGVCCQIEARKSCVAATGEAEGHDCSHTCAGAATCELAKLRPKSRRLTNDGLGPCIPTRAAWFSREVIALNAAIFVGGILLCCMALPQREAVFVPGPLSKPHAQILGNQLVADRCSLCHPNSHSVNQRDPQNKVVTQDDLCINCHQVDLQDAVHRSPHDLTDTQLNSLRAELLAGSQLVSNSNHHATHSPTQCASCHQEHHGAAHDLQAITDQRCQACHQTQFASFDKGHPEFESFPYRTERRIAFDHRAHADNYFAQKSETFDCKRCHLDPTKPGEVGPVARTVGFEQACAQCHAQPLEAAVSDGWALIQIPSIEAADTERPELQLNPWPATAQFGYDGPLTLPMRILLTADSAAAAALQLVPASGQLADIDPRKPEQVAAVQTIAVAVRRLLAEIAAEGQVAWQRRLTAVATNHLKRELRAHELELIERMTAGLPPDLFRQIEREWFLETDKLADVDDRARSPRARSVSYQDELLADDLLDDSLLDDSLLDDSLLDNASRDDLLSEDLLSGDLLSGDIAADEALLADEPTEGRSRQATTAAARQAFAKINGMKHVLMGGWYLDAELLAVRYRPRGHADPLFAAWNEYSALLTTEQHPGAAPLALTPPSSQLIPGGCTACHLLTEGALTRTSISSLDSPWCTVHRSATIRPFTKFDHQPHLTLPLVQDCRYCHVLNSSDKALGAVALGETTSVANQRPTESRTQQQQVAALAALQTHWTPYHLHLEFKPMEKSQCSACHRPNSAGDGCTQCHNYHVGQAGFEWSRQ
jgi:hypothetical protein